MKKLLLLALTTMMMVGCEDRTAAEIEEAKRLNGFNIIIVDSCEYLKSKEVDGYGFFAHKGNCKYCAERRKQELKELIEQLKDK